MPATPPIGIVAGAGGVPLELADDLQRRGIGVHVVGIAGFADPGIARFAHSIVGLGQLGGLLEALRRHHCREIVIVGALERPDLRRLRFDLGALWHLPAVLSLTRGGDDSLLRRIVRFFEAQGFVVRGIGEVAPGLLAPAGLIAGPPLSAAQQSAVARARLALQELSRFDIGQAVVAQPDGLVAVEAAEGTRRMLSRLAASGGAGADAMLVKQPKLGQEMRIDLPTIGAGTVAQAEAAGLAGIAVAAGTAVIAERVGLVAHAEAARISVIGLAGDSRDATALSPPDPAADATDAGLARLLAAAVQRHARPGVADVGVVVRREHALAVEIDGLAAGRWPERLAGLPRGWGLPQLRRRAGVLALLVVAAPTAETAARLMAVLPSLRRARLAALDVRLLAATAAEPGWSRAIEAAAQRAGIEFRLNATATAAGEAI